jgi:hypothetical protein
MTIDDAQQMVAEIIARAAAIDPAVMPAVRGTTPVDDALAAVMREIYASSQAMSEEIIEAGVKVVFPPLDLD